MVAPSQALNPDKKEQVDTDVEVQILEEKKALTELCDEEYLGSPYNDTTVPVIRAQRQCNKANRRRIWLQLLLFCGMIVGLTLCVIGSIRLYRGMYFVTGYEGRCGVGIVDMSVYNVSGDLSSGSVAYQYVEDVQIKENVETLKVPSLGNSSAATFRHDFDKNFTAVRDDLKSICFLVPFLKEFSNGAIPQPSIFADLLQRNEFEDDEPMVSEMKADFSFGDDFIEEVMGEFGSALAELCDGVTSYRASPRPADVLVLPSRAPPTESTTIDYDSMPLGFDSMYTMYPGGDSVFTYKFYHYEPIVYEPYTESGY